jgi:hypothetical protein
MRSTRACLPFFTMLLMSACDQSPAITLSQHAPQPIPSAAPLSVEDRQRLQPLIDVGALEMFTRTMEPRERERLLDAMRGAPDPRSGDTRNVSFPIGSTDPERQALLVRTWAPYLDRMSTSALERGGQPFPGQDLALARRRAQETVEKEGSKP